MTRSASSRDSILAAQQSLRQLGHGPLDDPDGELGPATHVALQAFQRERGLAITGNLDAVTMERLVEAGWHLGSRLLYVSRPLLRGDDVADLQESLALLGFDPGRIDGIYGPLTKRALEEFQANTAVEVSGVLTRETLSELSRFASRRSNRRPVTEARDAAGLNARGARRLVVISGHGAFSDDVAASLSSLVTVARSTDPEPAHAASLANDQDASLVVALRSNDDHTGLSIHYFASHRSKSLIGEALADDIARRIRSRCSMPVAVSGMSTTILRESAMPALDLAMPDLGDSLRQIAATCVVESVARLFDSPR